MPSDHAQAGRLSEGGLDMLEGQQARLVSALRRADGTVVTYADLRASGIEFPASVVSELELAGVPVERCQVTSAGRRQVLGVRLDPAKDPWRAQAPAGAEAEPHRGRPEIVPRPTADPARPSAWSAAANRRWLAPAALVVTGVAVLVLVVPGLGSGGASVRHVARHHRGATTAPLIAAQAPARPPTRAQSTQPPSTPVSLPLATQLESQGHGLLEAGEYAHAVPVLRRAVTATGQSLAACLQPASESCLIYAYALYDLGRALRLEGQLAAAVPVLEQRLQIDNQRGTVQAELQLAEGEAGSSASTGSSAGETG